MPDTDDLFEDSPRGSCWIFHRWGQWKTIEEGDLRNTATKATIGHYLIQKRTCTRCNKEELNKLRT